MKVIEVPTDGLVGTNENVATIGCPPTDTVAELEALTVLASVTVNDSTLFPFVVSVRLKVPVPVYGALPPVADTVQLNGLPVVTPLVGHDTVTTRGWPPTLTVADPEALIVLESVTVNDSVFEPLVGSVLLIVPVPV